MHRAAPRGGECMHSLFMFTIDRALVLVAALALFNGACGSKKASSSATPSTAGIITVNNIYRGTCSENHGRASIIRASVDGGPIVTVADNSKFEFANVAQGSHTLSLHAQGARFDGGGDAWQCRIMASGGSSTTVLVSCGANGTISPALQAAP